MKTVSTVISTFRVIGFHAWPGAFDEVKYLAQVHRHEFSFRLEAVVNHDDRSIEFHDLGRKARATMEALFSRNEFGEYVFNARSCEMIAKRLGEVLISQSFPISAVECWEDAENGARVTFEPTP